MMNTENNIKLFLSKSGKRVACLKFTEEVIAWALRQPRRVNISEVRDFMQNAAERNLGHRLEPQALDMMLTALEIMPGEFGEPVIFTLAAAVMQAVRD